MGQDPYGGGADFTPYRPGAPSDEVPSDGAPSDGAPSDGAHSDEVPYVPYGTPESTDTTPPPPTGTTPPPRKKQIWPWIVVAAVILAILGSCLGGIASIFGSSGSGDADLPEVLGANDLQENQCINGAGLAPDDDSGVSALEVVGCDTAHNAEVMAVVVLSAEAAADYDFDNGTQVNEICAKNFSDEERPLVDRDDLVLIAFTETRNPVKGDKVACLLVDAEGGLIRGPLLDRIAPGGSG